MVHSITYSRTEIMSLSKLTTAPLILLKDDINKNTLPLLLELLQHEKNSINMFCYEKPVSSWRKVFKEFSNVVYYEEYNPGHYEKYTKTKSCVVVDSVNQMALCLVWSECLRNLKSLLLNPNIVRIILILHKDCLSHFSKLQIHLNHLASAIVSYDSKDPYKINIEVKKGGKTVKSKEKLTYDNKTGTLKSIPVLKEEIKENEPEKPMPGNLSTFKIEVEQTEKLEKYKLKLPYMSKINEGESKVYYEPDAVDDWDEEDPDEDLDI